MNVLPTRVKRLAVENPITKNFYVTDIGYFPKATHHRRKREKGAEQYIFLYCTEGEGWLQFGNKHIKVLPNQFHLISKGISHAYGATDNNPWTIYWMHFDGSIAQQLFKRYLTYPRKIEGIPFTTDRIQLFNQIFNIFASSYTEAQIEFANILSTRFLASFIYDPLNNRSYNSHTSNSLVSNIIEFLVANLEQTYTSQEIAQKFNHSLSYIFSLFKKETGYSLMHFFNLKKMQKACEYLNYTGMNITEVSRKVGFQDPLYFSRLFKKYMGVSPRSYRQKQYG